MCSSGWNRDGATASPVPVLGYERAAATARNAALPRVLAIDTVALLRRHGASAFFARINTGAVLRVGARVRRDDTTFVSVADYQSGPVANWSSKPR